MVELAQQIRQLAAAQSIELAPAQSELLADYAEILWQWNEKLNLTRHTTPELFVQRDVLDAYQLAKLLRPNEEVLDLGSGGGVPGVLLKILRPDLQVTLTESIGKKAEVLAAIVTTMGIEAVVHKGRAEELLAEERFDAVVARAVGPLRKLLALLQDHWLSVGRLLAIKGPRWVEERREAREKGLLGSLELRKEIEYDMPQTESHSVILKIWPRTVPEVIVS